MLWNNPRLRWEKWVQVEMKQDGLWVHLLLLQLEKDPWKFITLFSTFLYVGNFPWIKENNNNNKRKKPYQLTWPYVKDFSDCFTFFPFSPRSAASLFSLLIFSINKHLQTCILGKALYCALRGKQMDESPILGHSLVGKTDGSLDKCGQVGQEKSCHKRRREEKQFWWVSSGRNFWKKWDLSWSLKKHTVVSGGHGGASLTLTSVKLGREFAQTGKLTYKMFFLCLKCTFTTIWKVKLKFKILVLIWTSGTWPRGERWSLAPIPWPVASLSSLPTLDFIPHHRSLHGHASLSSYIQKSSKNPTNSHPLVTLMTKGCPH